MLKNYFKIAIRNLWRNKVFSAINIFGLTLGIATCLLIMLYVQHELSFDRYNEKADRMVRVTVRGNMQGGELKEAVSMSPIAQTFKKDFPEVLEATRIRMYGRPSVIYNNKTYRGDAVAFVDSNFFQVFTIPLLMGDAKQVLQKPNTVVISRAVAQKYFGNENPLGKVLIFKDNNTPLTVTGMINEVPANSHFHFDLFISMTSMQDPNSDSWLASNVYTYLVLPKGYDYKKLEARLPQEVEKYLGPQLQAAMGVSLSQFRKNGNSIGLYLQPLTDIHLHSDLTADMEPYGDIHYVYIFSAIAVFMLLIACINFMNLSTASASKRAREVGIRKVMGSVKLQLIGQFLMESLLLTAVAMLFSIALVYWALPFFNRIAEQHLTLQFRPWIVLTLLLFGLFTGLLAGSYPAFYLSSFNPVTVLKGRFSSSKKSIGFRSGLVVFQFFISIGLIIATAVVYRQLSYIQHKKLGYDKDKVLVIQETYWLGNNQEAFRQQLLHDPRVVSVTRSGYLPAGYSYNNNFFAYPDNRSTQFIKTLRYEVDYDYISTLGMQMAAGRNFSKEFGADSAGVILNETAAMAFGWGQHALGHTITHVEPDGTKTYHVIGIVKDFHFRSLHELITPLVMTLGIDYGTMIAKINTPDISGLLKSIKQKWDDLKPESAFSYSFLDERYENTYRSEQNIGIMLGIFAGLTIFVACLGLFGLATFTAEQRVKEIGIRKVLGADVAGIVSLLSKDFLKLVFIAFIIASPLAWFVMNKWLQDFAYRISMSWWMFVLAGFLAMLIAVITISFKAIKAATANPAVSLRSE